MALTFAPEKDQRQAAVDVPVVESTDDGIKERALVATCACIARLGFTKTTLDDVARATQCSRATLYRYFPSKAEMVRDAVRAEVVRITNAIHLAAQEQDNLEDTVVAVLLVAGREIGEHPALRYVADFESERLLPHLAFTGGDRFLSRAAKIITPCLEPYLGDESNRAAEWIARNGLTLWLTPADAGALTNPVSLRAYVREFVLPAFISKVKKSKIENTNGR